MDETNKLEWKQRTCCFTGHRILSSLEQESIRQQLPVVLKKRIEEGYCCFVAGGALGFDTLAALTVLELRELYPHIRLQLVLPCHNQEIRWRKKDQEVYHSILRQADAVVYTSDSYSKDCMKIRNRAMVEQSSYCVTFMRTGISARSGTISTVKYAQSQGLKVENLYQ